MIEHLSEPVALTISLATLVGLLVGLYRWGNPKLERRAQERRDERVVLYGRKAIPPNPVTSEPGQPEVLPLGQRLDRMLEMLERQGALIDEVHHEVRYNDGSSLKDAVKALREETGEQFTEVTGRLGRIEGQVGGVVTEQTDTLKHAAAASREVVHLVHDAILADPPRPDDSTPDLD